METIKSILYLVKKNCFMAKIDLKDQYGQTAMHHAVENEHLHILKYLKENQAKFDQKDNKEFTPLHVSVQNGKLEIYPNKFFLINNRSFVYRWDSYPTRRETCSQWPTRTLLEAEGLLGEPSAPSRIVKLIRAASILN